MDCVAIVDFMCGHFDQEFMFCHVTDVQLFEPSVEQYSQGLFLKDTNQFYV